MKHLSHRDSRQNLQSIIHNPKSSSAGFTIVELLIVVVVIGILAAISIVAYTGIQQRATVASLTSDLDNSFKKLKLYQVDNSAYPTGLDCSASPAVNTICLKSSDGTVYSDYTVNNATPTPTFCVSATTSGTSYYTTQDGQSSSGNCPNTNGLVGWWKFNGNANDSSGYNNNGTVNGATLTTGQGGLVNNAYYFNGVDNYIGISSTQQLPQTAGTITMWTKLIDNGLVQNFFFFGTSTEDGCTGTPAIALSSCGFMIQSGASAVNPAVPVITDNQWHNLIGTWDSSVSSVVVYLDGVQRSTSGLPFVPSFAQQTTTIGKPGSNSRYTYGSLDDIRVYNRALTPAEVSALYAAGAQ